MYAFIHLFIYSFICLIFNLFIYLFIYSSTYANYMPCRLSIWKYIDIDIYIYIVSMAYHPSAVPIRWAARCLMATGSSMSCGIQHDSTHPRWKLCGIGWIHQHLNANINIWGFPQSWGYPNSWMFFVREYPSYKWMIYIGVPSFMETPIWIYIYIYVCVCVIVN